jgi:hypothetical protein
LSFSVEGEEKRERAEAEVERVGGVDNRKKKFSPKKKPSCNYSNIYFINSIMEFGIKLIR